MKKLLLLLSALALGSQLSAQGIISDLTVQRTASFPGDITPSQITTNTNDYAPTDLNKAFVLRLSTDAARDITGLTGGARGRMLWIYNVGSFTFTLKSQSSSSSAANRFAFAADHALVAGTATLLIYDSTASRWREAGSVADLSSLNASNLSSGTIPDARFPATLPAASGVNLTALNASNLGSGTVPDARFPSVVPIAGHGLFTEVSAPSTPASGKVAIYAKADGLLYSKDDAGTEVLVSSGAGGSGDVVGPSSATDNALARFDSTTGKLIQNSNVTLADSGTAFSFSAGAGITSNSSSDIVFTAASGTGLFTTPSDGVDVSFNINCGPSSPPFLRLQRNGSTKVILAVANAGSSLVSGSNTDDTVIRSDANKSILFSTDAGGSIGLKVVASSGQVSAEKTTSSTSTSTGALISKGGLGVAENLNVGGSLTIATHTPSSSSDTGTTGTIAWDGSFLYVCVATDTWARVAIAIW